MGKSTAFSDSLLKLILNATPIANLCDNAASSPLTSVYVSLHTADPTAAGNQTSSEIAYTSYARVTVARTSGGWTVTGTSVSPTATIAFPAGTGGTGTATFAAIGTAPTGTGMILYSGSLSPSIVCGSGITPQIGTGSVISEA